MNQETKSVTVTEFRQFFFCNFRFDTEFYENQPPRVDKSFIRGRIIYDERHTIVEWRRKSWDLKSWEKN